MKLTKKIQALGQNDDLLLYTIGRLAEAELHGVFRHGMDVNVTVSWYRNIDQNDTRKWVEVKVRVITTEELPLYQFAPFTNDGCSIKWDVSIPGGFVLCKRYIYTYDEGDLL
jgi:hypothetical protein